jgi:hypothetical protein
MRLDDETTDEVTFPETSTNSMITLVPLNLRVPRRILPPFSACGMSRMDIGPAGVYGIHLAGGEVIEPLLSNRDRTANERSAKGHPKPLYRYLHDGRRLGLVSWMRPHGR